MPTTSSRRKTRHSVRSAKTRKCGRQAAEEIDRGDEIGDAEQDHRRRLVDAGQLEQQRRRERAGDHVDRVERIDRADDARAPVLARPGSAPRRRSAPRTGRRRRNRRASSKTIRRPARRRRTGRGRSRRSRRRERRSTAPRSMAKTPMMISRKGAGASSMRPCDSTAASSEPAATPMAKTSVDRRLDFDAAADARLDDDRDQRQGDRADHPEPAHRRRADPLAVVGLSSRRIFFVAVQGL